MSERDQQGPIRVTVWGENVHERREPEVRERYPRGMHAAIAGHLCQCRPSCQCPELAIGGGGQAPHVLFRLERRHGVTGKAMTFEIDRDQGIPSRHQSDG